MMSVRNPKDIFMGGKFISSGRRGGVKQFENIAYGHHVSSEVILRYAVLRNSWMSRITSSTIQEHGRKLG